MLSTRLDDDDDDDDNKFIYSVGFNILVLLSIYFLFISLHLCFFFLLNSKRRQFSSA